MKLVGVCHEAGRDQIAWIRKMKEGGVAVADVYNVLYY